MASTRKSLMRTIGIAIPTSMAVLAIGSGAAWAQTIYNLAGSDTLTQVIQQAITSSGANLNYQNQGSGQGEKNIANLSGITQFQSIAPMSRNFVATVLTMSGISAPTSDNVLCLDAGVVAVKAVAGNVSDIKCSATPGNNACDATCDVNTNYLAIALGGYPSTCRASGTWSASTATTAECADPKRLDAIAKLNVGPTKNHFLRRDDGSGTQDTFRERLQFSRWCNGKSKGTGATANLSNEDLDPVRKTCLNEVGMTVAETRCTYYPLEYPAVGSTCYHGDTLAANDPNNPYGVDIPCTQGWVVALSQADPGQSDITISIGKRIQLDFEHHTMGGAGLAALNVDSVGVTINTDGFDEDTIRGGHYAMWRRLFLQNRTPLVNYANAAARDAACQAWLTSNGVSAGDAAGRCTAEQKLYDWATNRQNLCDLCVTAGFYAPLPGCHQPISGCPDTLNMTCVAALAGLGTPAHNVGGEAPGAAQHGAACDGTYPCVANGKTKDSDGNCSGAEAGKCPVIPVETAGYACNLASKCSGPATCGGTPLVCGGS